MESGPFRGEALLWPATAATHLQHNTYSTYSTAQRVQQWPPAVHARALLVLRLPSFRFERQVLGQRALDVRKAMKRPRMISSAYRLTRMGTGSS